MNPNYPSITGGSGRSSSIRSHQTQHVLQVDGGGYVYVNGDPQQGASLAEWTVVVDGTVDVESGTFHHVFDMCGYTVATGSTLAEVDEIVINGTVEMAKLTGNFESANVDGQTVTDGPAIVSATGGGDNPPREGACPECDSCCPDCDCQDEYDEGYDKGYDDGYDDGQDDCQPSEGGDEGFGMVHLAMVAIAALVIGANHDVITE